MARIERLHSTPEYTRYFKDIQRLNKFDLFKRFDDIESIMNKKIDEKYRHFLAKPIIEGDSIHWFSKLDNAKPERLPELQGEDRSKYEQIKNETLAHYKNVVNSLRQEGKSSEAEALENATKFVNDKFIFCFDNKTVLGVWGMQLKDSVRDPIGTASINEFVKKPKKNPPVVDDKTPIGTPYTDRSNTDEDGNLNGTSDYPKNDNDMKHPWWKRLWFWFTDKGCLKWLLWLILLLLLLLLIGWLFRSCSGPSGGGAALGDSDSAWLRDDPNRGFDGGIYDPYHPYKPVPTPPGYEDVLPPQQGMLPPIDGDLEIIPGNPSIIANRLNILMENEDKSILDLAKDFKTKYPGEKYKVVYYDNVVKRMQIIIPKEKREQLKQVIPEQFAPEYELFIFDEALFEGVYTPNDPAFSDSNKAWYLNAIRAPQAWDITRGSEKITVAIVDNGFNLKHPELSSKVVQPYNVWKRSNEVFPQQVDHGTHVAGTALAIANNKKGICGVAPNCKFMPVQVADKRGIMTTTSVLDGILYALYQGADVINVSLGNQFTSLSQFPESTQQDLIRHHFKEEERLWREIMRIAANHNSTIVIAAGNDNVLAGINALQRPELFITVSATDKDNQIFSKAAFSNYGALSTLSAPGVSIYSSVGKNNYQTMDGTSMAAPIVAGAVALMRSINDTITTKQIICILQATGMKTQGNIGKLIQIDKALEKVLSGEIVDCTPAPSTGDVQILLSWNNYNDLDLICTDPFGESVSFRNRQISSGGKLEIDMNVEYPDSKTPVENIYWESGNAPNGTYNVFLSYYRRHESAIDETPYNIQVKYGEKTENYSGVIKKADHAIHICTFTLSK